MRQPLRFGLYRTYQTSGVGTGLPMQMQLDPSRVVGLKMYVPSTSSLEERKQDKIDEWMDK